MESNQDSSQHYITSRSFKGFPCQVFSRLCLGFLSLYSPLDTVEEHRGGKQAVGVCVEDCLLFFRLVLGIQSSLGKRETISPKICLSNSIGLIDN